METAYVHPEVRKEVKREFDRLHSRYPDIDGMKKWHMSKALVFATALADTAILKQEMGI